MKRLLPLLSLAPLLLVTMGAGPCDSQPLGSVDAGTTCTYQGKTYAHGASVPSNDNCNTCTCTSSGQIACTTKACICYDDRGISMPCPVDGGAPDGGADGSAREVGSFDGGGTDLPICYDNKGNTTACPTTDAGAQTCDYLGKPYPVGSSFPSSDGCSTCSCQAGGEVACIQRACFDAGVDGPTVCDYAGLRYAAGAAFPATDGCNTCSCSASGVACTKKACVPDAGSVDGSVITGACTAGKVGADQACNEDPTVSTLRGKCKPDGSCECPNGVVSPYTGKCLGAGNTTGEGCEYQGKVQLVGATFTCADGCNKCTCKAPGAIVTTDAACGDAGTSSTCGLDGIYIYGSIGGKVAYQDQVTIAPSTTSPATAATYVLTRSSNGGSSGVSCSPAFPACGSPTALDVSDIMADILDPVVQKYLSTKGATAFLFGLDTRPIDGPIFSFQRGGAFLVGAPCNGATGCTEIPAAIEKLVADLRALDQQQLQSPACAAVVAAPPKP